MDLFQEHPGIELRNIIKQKDMNISEFARMIDVSPSRINEIVHALVSVSNSLAYEEDDAFVCRKLHCQARLLPVTGAEDACINGIRNSVNSILVYLVMILFPVAKILNQKITFPPVLLYFDP